MAKLRAGAEGARRARLHALRRPQARRVGGLPGPGEPMGAGAVPAGAVGERRPTLVERMRRVHQRMVDAALTGDGFDRMAELAAEEVGPPDGDRGAELDVAVVWPGDTTASSRRSALTEERGRAARRARFPRRRAGRADLVRRRLVGAVGMLAGDDGRGRGERVPAPRGHRSATALALEEARERERRSPGRRCFPGSRRDGRCGDGPAARPSGCDLDAGAIVGVTELAPAGRARRCR